MSFQMKFAQAAIFAVLLSTQAAHAANGSIEECNQSGNLQFAPRLPQDLDREIILLLNSWTTARTYTALPILPRNELNSRLKLTAGQGTDEALEVTIQDLINKTYPAAACLDSHLRSGVHSAVVKGYAIVTLPSMNIAAAIKLKPNSLMADPWASIYISKGRERAIYLLSTQSHAFLHLPFDKETPQINPNQNPHVAFWDAVYSKVFPAMKAYLP